MVDFARLPLYLGPVTMSPAAAAAMGAPQQTVFELLARHAAGDWGEVDDEERAANWTALAGGAGLICSVYRLAGGAKVIVATEMNPRQTSIVTPEEA